MAAPDEDEDEEKFMRTVVGYIRRHLAQRPEGDISETRWRYSLKNWGHDPLKDDGKQGASTEDEDEMTERGCDARREGAGSRGRESAEAERERHERGGGGGKRQRERGRTG